MPGTVTVGLDGTDHSLAAADWAAAEATRRGAGLRLVHAWVWRPLEALAAADEEVQRRWATEILQDAAARVAKNFPDLPATTEILADEPVAALVAASAAADLLVLGSRGHSTLVGYLLGSVGLQVLRQAPGPVVLVRSPRPDEAARPRDEVVVGVQDVRESDPVLEFAFSAAAAQGVGLRAVRAWSVPPVVVWGGETMRAADDAGGLEPLERKRLADAVRPWRERFPQVEVVEHVEMGGAGQVLLAAGARARLLVVGRRGPGRHELRKIGAVAHAALHHAPCPVAVVPHP
ncbi:universal stress protein [Streptomyces albofaciens JCM 4342]|uniref:universal stress protein n=1 Tax=Streptomyces albofaciens TaxID=66866 RepID=UPI001238A282|nr:universal stress protein [Streptomyces albofaciens]KAA6223535.1 universal stress protein [Streptomyces albofaciens JCM 4342]